ncbi:tetratricopeptide repeat-containing sensor histidine kinase [Neolewinella persica]|uniref:tetratricopeptide repeat-containing sensor histidine kinase n=1 Tax=Neolewinella persica TaxID=70998 RepID=UPI000379E8A5|nr:tetratricopeptide repeat-containing sensor histidine kinase [Neolewinella persica]
MRIAVLYLFLPLLLGVFSNLTAQVSGDSLLKVAMGIPEVDDRDQYFAKMLKEIDLNTVSNLEKIFAYRLEESKQFQTLDIQVERMIDLAKEYVIIGKVALADSLASAYLQRADEVSPQAKVSLYMAVGDINTWQQDYSQAIYYDSLGLSLIEEYNLPLTKSYVKYLHQYGDALSFSGNFVKGAQVLDDALEAFEVVPTDSSKLLEIYRSIGILYSQIGLYDKAVDYLDLHKKFGSLVKPIDHTLLEVNIGRNLLLKKDYPAALKRYRSARTIELPQGQLPMLPIYIYNGLVEGHYQLANKDSVNHYFNQLQGAFSEMGSPDFLRFLYRQSAWLNNLVNGNYAEAERDGRLLYEESIAKNDVAEQVMYSEFLSDTYRARGDYQLAEQFTRKFMNLKDSIQSVNRNNVLLLYYNQFETEEKEKEIILLDQQRELAESKRRQYAIIAGLLGLFLAGGIFFYLKLGTARKTLFAQNQELEALNHTKNRFFSIIAHDLHNPIIALAGADRQLEHQLAQKNDAQVKKTVGLISQTANQLRGLLDNLLAWALGQSGAIELKKAPHPLKAFVSKNLSLYGGAANANGISLENNVHPETMVFADGNALHTILRNFISNAVKYSNDGGTIEVSHTRAEGEDIISVKDSGTGISKAAQEQLFSLHRRLKSGTREEPGTGLGLILCKELAELHGGRVVLESTSGEGTIAKVYLPDKVE